MRSHARSLIFRNRADAGRQLGSALPPVGRDALVLALPRGGAPVAREVATALGVELGLFLVRKLGVPGREELAMGALASGGVRILNDEVIRYAGITEAELERVTEAEQRELERRERLYQVGRNPLRMSGRTVILVDDGLATGATMRAALRAVRSRGAERVIVAVPVAPSEAVAQLKIEADDVICLETPEPFVAVGRWYQRFGQLSHADVVEALTLDQGRS